MAQVSSSIEADSFHRQVGVTSVISCSGLLEAVAVVQLITVPILLRSTFQGRILFAVQETKAAGSNALTTAFKYFKLAAMLCAGDTTVAPNFTSCSTTIQPE